MSAPTTKLKVRWAAVIVQLLTGVLLGMLAAWALTGGGIPASVNEDELLPPCATEDSTGCYWDAGTRGNGQGSDVVTLEGE